MPVDRLRELSLFTGARPAAESTDQKSLAGKQSDMSNGTNTASESSPSESKTESLIKHQFLTTSESSTREDLRKPIVDTLMSSQQAFRNFASLSPSPESAKPATMNETCGRPRWTLSRLSSLPLCSLKTFPDCSAQQWTTNQGDLFTTLERFSENWPKQGMTSGGVCWELTMLEHLTIARDCGFTVPTPASSERGGKQNPVSQLTLSKWVQGYRKDGSISGEITKVPVNQRFWATPTRSESYHDPVKFAKRMEKYNNNTVIPSLTTQVLHPEFWPTLSARDWKGTSKDQTPRDTLDCAIELGQTKSKTYSNTDQVQNVGGKLNPYWVELLMGWPMGSSSLNKLSHVEYIFWLLGMVDEKKDRKNKILPVLQKGHAAKEIQRATGRYVSIPESAFLLSLMCQHAGKIDTSRILLSCEKALKEKVRGMSLHQKITSSSYRSRYYKQRAKQHSNLMQALSRFLAHYGQKAWQKDSWENAVPRVNNGVADRVNRIKALGNGQVPICMAVAYEILSSEFSQ